MTVYVAEISGRGVVAFDAADEVDARARLADRAFRRDLIVHQNEGRPLWDGASEIHVRIALPKETESWQTSHALAIQSGKSMGRTGVSSWSPSSILPVRDSTMTMMTMTMATEKLLSW